MPGIDLSDLPPQAIEERHLAGTGPGGQNVNKVASAIQLRIDATALGLTPAVYRRLKELAGSRMTGEGVIVLTARAHRTQEANRREAMARLEALLDKAHRQPEKRIRTKPSRAAKAKRVDTKKARSAVNQKRSKPQID